MQCNYKLCNLTEESQNLSQNPNPSYGNYFVSLFSKITKYLSTIYLIVTLLHILMLAKWL